MWNERDPILKERLFGLTNSEGNHGEDVKEYYFYLDSTPTHSYMKYLYKYPQREFPYRDSVETNRRRSREEFEYELLDTGVFDDDRYFDVFVEYAKAGPEDILDPDHGAQPRAGSGPASSAADAVVPQHLVVGRRTSRKPSLREAGPGVIEASHHELGEYVLHVRRAPELLFTENETNAQRLWGQPNGSPVRQGCLPRVRGRGTARRGQSRAGRDQGCRALRRSRCPAAASQIVRLRL